MPRRNRVDPFGRIIAVPERGSVMGNRGCLHDDAGDIVRASARDAWIICVPVWPGIRRPLMRPGHYTELFFLDDATAMAAGHRPCGSCRPEALARFKRAWQQAFVLDHPPKVSEIDSALRAAGKLDNNSGQRMDGVPDGGMIAADAQPLLRWRGKWLAWRSAGYVRGDPPTPLQGRLLTPQPILAVFQTGYRPDVHSSADHTVSVMRQAGVSSEI